MKVNLAAEVDLHPTYSIIVPCTIMFNVYIYVCMYYIWMHFCIILICIQVLSSSVSAEFKFIGKEEFEVTA